MIKRGGVSWPVDERISSFFEEMRNAGSGHEGQEGCASSPLGGPPFMRVPDPALLTEALSESEERGERGSWLTRMR